MLCLRGWQQPRSTAPLARSSLPRDSATSLGMAWATALGWRSTRCPFLGATSTDRIEATVPVTVEPGVYLPGRGGVRIEDTVVVHHDRVEILTTFPRDLLVVA